jgi:hypothetical protein
MDNRGRTESLTKLAKHGVTEEQRDAAVALGQRWCSECKQFLDKDKFYDNPKARRCIECSRKYCLEYSKDNRERNRARSAKNYRENAEENRRIKKEFWASLPKEQRAEIGRRGVLRKYGLKPEDYDRMLAEQGGHCATCDFVPKKRPLCVDHDHETGANRGLLCVECNVVIGFLEKHSERLPIFKEYLAKHVRHSEVT